jgi:hypothetical protein
MSNVFIPAHSAANVGDINVVGVGINATGDGVFISVLLWNFIVNESLEFSSMGSCGCTKPQHEVFLEYLSDTSPRSPNRTALARSSRRQR